MKNQHHEHQLLLLDGPLDDMFIPPLLKRILPDLESEWIITCVQGPGSILVEGRGVAFLCYEILYDDKNVVSCRILCRSMNTSRHKFTQDAC